jgi:hypothetical protein
VAFRERDQAAYDKLAQTSRSLEHAFNDMQQYGFVYRHEYRQSTFACLCKGVAIK